MPQNQKGECGQTSVLIFYFAFIFSSLQWTLLISNAQGKARKTSPVWDTPPRAMVQSSLSSAKYHLASYREDCSKSLNS